MVSYHNTIPCQDPEDLDFNFPLYFVVKWLTLLSFIKGDLGLETDFAEWGSS
jgi:hypothetical protein